MYDVTKFIKWALTHVKKQSVPAGAELPLPAGECGTEPWHYLFGTVKSKTTKNKIEERWENYYSSHGWTRVNYDKATEDFHAEDYATDCQGLLDAWLTEQGEKTDINSNMNYTQWCSEKGLMTEIDRPYVLGEAVFRANSSGRIVHVGFICGTLNGEPLVVEARGLSYGTVVSVLSKRNFTHRGLMTKKFNYDENGEGEVKEMIKFEVTSPMQKGEAFKAMQVALNAAGYTDEDDKTIDEDGKWGKRSMEAFEKLIAANTNANKHTVSLVVDGKTVFNTTV
ncbi:MAG: hypothetical protein J1E60_06845 [Christensenellaceae bacterium]|nr:hypothetical protein [Christensenellaceae bacterium]